MGINSSDPSKVAADSKHAPLPKVDRYFESSVHRVFDPIVAQAKVYTDWRKGIEQNFLPFNPGDKPMTRKDIFPPRSSDGLIHNSTHEVLGWFAASTYFLVLGRGDVWCAFTVCCRSLTIPLFCVQIMQLRRLDIADPLCWSCYQPIRIGWKHSSYVACSGIFTPQPQSVVRNIICCHLLRCRITNIC